MSHELNQHSLMGDDVFCEDDTLVQTTPRTVFYGVVFGDDGDSNALRLYALDLLGSLKRAGVPQSATRPIRQFALAWNTSQPDQPILADGKYTKETQAALDAALSALAPGQGSAPTAVL